MTKRREGFGPDLRQYLNFVWRNWMLIVSVTAFVFLIGVIYVLRATPLYTASTQVLLQRHEKAPGVDAAVNDGRVEDYYYVENQLAILRSDSLLRRVVINDRLGLSQLVSSEPQRTDVSRDVLTSAEEQRIRNGINTLRGALAISRTSGDAQVINISITWDDSVRAAQLANAVADAYVVDQLDARLEAAKRASALLSDRIAELRRQLGDSEDAVGKFRKEHGLTRSGPTVALNDQQLAEGQLDNDVAVRLRELERTAAVNKTLFEEFLQKAKITDERATFRARDIRVIMPAQPGGQNFPDTRKILLTALVAGLGLGIGGAFVMEMLRAGFTSGE